MLLSVKKYDQHLYRNYEDYLEDHGFRHIGSGAFRTAFKRAGVVVKIPNSDMGLVDNIAEAYAYNKYRKSPDVNGIVYAPCRLLRNGCLMMVYVEYSHEPDMPKWIGYIDGCQCGRFNGRAVVYDSGTDLHRERADALRWAGMT